MLYVLVNPLALNGKAEENVAEAVKNFEGMEYKKLSLIDLDVRKIISELSDEDKVLLIGGDGTLNRFANDTADMDYPCDIYLYKSGTGNDFMKDVEDKVKNNMVKINEYLTDLPSITVKGKTYRYINGIGYGIDGMCCEVADKMKAEGKENINYAGISIKLLIHGYKCPDAKVTVDGKVYNFKKVWLASAMKGRFYGGGLNIAPSQDRKSGKLTAAIVHSSGKLKTLIVFPQIFKGQHVKHKKMFTAIEGREITVEFTHPMALQIDGETVLGVTSYTVKSPAKVKA
ncbi:MAG: diacylglycerol kinase family protein [Ruminococcaceae bacterium]|nr:diacylglycerol kinase family protein [Oscillospiraceae bacterium]